VTEKGQSIAEGRGDGHPRETVADLEDGNPEESQGEQQAFPGHGQPPPSRTRFTAFNGENRRLLMET